MTNQETLKLALEALKSISEMVDYEGNGFKLEYEIKALEEALAKQEQGEPVAWVILFCGGPVGFFEKEADAIEEFERRNLDYPEKSRKLLPLYTTPPQRKPLTDEEYSIMAEQYTGADGLDCVDFGRAISRHYGIKE